MMHGPARPHRSRRSALLLAAALGVFVAVAPGPAVAEEYDPQRAGHPLRIIAYVLHPVGVVLDRVIFRPAWWLGSHEPLRTLFGRGEAPVEPPETPVEERLEERIQELEADPDA